jgi:hypothetical protein
MPRNLPLSGLLPAVVVATGLVVLPLEIVTEAQQQTPAGPAAAATGPDLDGVWTSDDMRGIPTSRQAAMGTRESMTPEEFARRAGGDESSRDRAVNQETFLRNEFGVRTFGYTSFVVDPPNGQIPQVTPAAPAKGLPIPPRTMGMEVYSGGQVEGRQPVRELGGAR